MYSYEMDGTVNKILYGYFSEKQHLTSRRIKNTTYKNNKYETTTNNGYNIWLTDDGREVKTSEVISTRNDDYMKSYWPDTIYLGRLVKWLRYVRYDYPPSYIHKFYFPTTFKNINDIQTLENFTMRHPIEEKVKTKTLPPISVAKNKKRSAGSGLNAVRNR